MKNAAVIIGATGGIGSEYAHQLADAKYDLLLLDKDVKKLQELYTKLKEVYNVQVEVAEINLTEIRSVNNMVNMLASRKRVDMLVHAAGYAEKTFFHKEEIARSMDMVSVHVLSALQLIHAVLPGMVKRKRGAIITLSSLAAFIPAPGSSIYSATKSFLNTFMESLHLEVHRTGVKVQSLCPGLTHTGFHSDADIRRFDNIPGLNLWMEAGDVVKISLEQLGKQVVCVPGLINKSIRNTTKLLPRKSYYALADKLYAKMK